MKDPRYTEIVCKGRCGFYKPGKERLSCGSYDFIRRNLTPKELSSVDTALDNKSMSAICEECAFYEGSCDFVQKSGEKGSMTPPCGGYKILSGLF